MEARRLTKKAVVDAAVVRIVNQALRAMAENNAGEAEFTCDEEKAIFTIDVSGTRKETYSPLPLFHACVGRFKILARLPLNTRKLSEEKGNFWLNIDGRLRNFQIEVQKDESTDCERVIIRLLE